ncbi:MAG: class I SAM-dependent methyltransferase [Actinomycetota bacterium]|jgi:SAM-dependent methyltransferase|nr:class I SAM-dependent methyltransferase [Actinomycetota bacterium]
MVEPTHEDAPVDAAAFWEDRYAERRRIWSGEPNAALVDAASRLQPGRALDLGCGEGGDAVWLAEQGWQVTGVDISATAAARCRALAAERGIADDRVTWLVCDLATWDPTDRYDLVTSCFLHSPVDFPRAAVLRRAAAAVAPGGHLLVVAHADPPPWSRRNHHGVEGVGGGHHHGPHDFPSPDDERAELGLDDGDWDIVVSEVRSRETTGPDGEQATLRDTVTLARRRTAR